MLWKEARHKKKVEEENCPIAMAKTSIIKIENNVTCI